MNGDGMHFAHCVSKVDVHGLTSSINLKMC
jgi:hypothetical protein